MAHLSRMPDSSIMMGINAQRHISNRKQCIRKAPLHLSLTDRDSLSQCGVRSPHKKREEEHYGALPDILPRARSSARRLYPQNLLI